MIQTYQQLERDMISPTFQEQQSMAEESEDEIAKGLNDSQFDFNQFKFQGGVDLDEIEEPEAMQDMFESQYGKSIKGRLYSESNAAQEEDKLIVNFDEEDPFKGQEIELAEIELEDIQGYERDE